MSTSARVFISCGQSSAEERNIALAIAARLRDLGFDPYIAVEEQTYRGVVDNIFAQLARSEYMVFVDFKREPIGDSHATFRGSLFSNQELAIAVFRQMEFICLQEDGVERNGIASFIQANAIPFSDRRQLARMVVAEATRRSWKPEWHNELSFDDKPPSTLNAIRHDRDHSNNTSTRNARYWHIHVTNRHHSKPAINCCAYLESVVNKTTGVRFECPAVEFKWAGSIFPYANIGPKSHRAFDAFYAAKGQLITTGELQLLQFNALTDSSLFVPQISHPGDYEFRYRVIAQNFPTIAASFQVHLPPDPFETELTLAPKEGSKQAPSASLPRTRPPL